MRARLEFIPAIEGMRALAVVAVVLGHTHFPGFGGGFVGVDVFFVISGFLICRFLFAELEQNGRVALLRFWSRRVRRLLPNATLTFLATLAVGLILVPGFMRADLARDVTMSALQVSNHHFAAKAVDYFRHDDPLSPVLHFWSLSVEEQFYIVWPVLLALLCLLFRRRALMLSRFMLLAIVAASLAGMLIAITASQPVAFFHSWARAWQLGIGGLLAVAFTTGVGLPGTRLGDNSVLQTLLQGLGWAGLAAVLAAIHLFDESTLYPGWRALIPTLGAAAMIASVALVPQTGFRIAAPLSSAVPRWIGARSYSWYLWHWPVLIFAEFASPGTPAIGFSAAFASLGIASVVYRYVEDPIHRGRRLAMPPGQTLLAGLASILLVVAAAAGFQRVPAPGDTHARARDVRIRAAIQDLGAIYPDKCHLVIAAIQQPECEYGVAGARNRVVLFGDSLAAQWFSAVQAAALAEGWSFRSWTKSSCPSIDIRLWYAPRRAAFHECDTWRESVMAKLTGPERPDVVVISNLQDYSGWIENPDRPGELLRRFEAEPIIRAGFMRIVKRFVDVGIGVIVVRETPRMIRSFRICYVGGGGSACDLTRERAQPRPWIDVEVARAFSAGGRVRLLDLTDAICEANVCRGERDGEVIWRDSQHIRSAFALRQSEHFRRLLVEIRATLPGE